jgi:hypothetical protein
LPLGAVGRDHDDRVGADLGVALEVVRVEDGDAAAAPDIHHRDERVLLRTNHDAQRLSDLIGQAGIVHPGLDIDLAGAGREVKERFLRDREVADELGFEVGGLRGGRRRRRLGGRRLGEGRDAEGEKPGRHDR